VAAARVTLMSMRTMDPRRLGRPRLPRLAVAVAWCVASFAVPGAAIAQEPAAPAAAAAADAPAPPVSSGFRINPRWLDDQAGAPGGQASAPACNACPRRRPGFAAFEVFGINLAFNLVNRFRPPEERDQFKVGPSSWWENLKYGFEWDDNSFGVNQIGHPYQGGLYFNAARSNGLSYWESSPYAAFGSAMWEYFGEKNKPALNDFINTTVGGMAIGEMLHRAGWLIRDTTKTGGARTKSELLAMLVDPITGLNRFMSGETKQVSEKPEHLAPERKVSDFEGGVLWRGDDTRAVNSTGEPYLQLNLGYGNLLSSPYRQPFDAFTVALRLGGGSAISEANIRGRLYGRYFGAPETPRHEFMVVQAYDFAKNSVYEFGGQTIAPVVGSRFRVSARNDITTVGGGGVLLLGAFSSPFVFGKERDYDYGPGLWGLASAVWRRDGRPIFKLGYNLIYMHVVSGTAGDHVAQAIGADALLPLRKQLRLGVAAEYIRRKIYYDYEDDVDNHYPQIRVYLAWVSK
jgi:hypothetical protein